MNAICAAPAPGWITKFVACTVPRTTISLRLPLKAMAAGCTVQNGMSAEPAAPPAVDAQPVRSSTKIASDTLAHRPSCWLMQTPGSGPSLAAHCVSVEQGPQVLLAVSQIGF